MTGTFPPRYLGFGGHSAVLRLVTATPLELPNLVESLAHVWCAALTAVAVRRKLTTITIASGDLSQ